MKRFLLFIKIIAKNFFKYYSNIFEVIIQCIKNYFGYLKLMFLIVEFNYTEILR